MALVTWDRRPTILVRLKKTNETFKVISYRKPKKVSSLTWDITDSSLQLGECTENGGVIWGDSYPGEEMHFVSFSTVKYSRRYSLMRSAEFLGSMVGQANKRFLSLSGALLEMDGESRCRCT